MVVVISKKVTFYEDDFIDKIVVMSRNSDE